MLVLRRKPGESVLIGRDIRFGVERVEGQTVVLGMDGPDFVRFTRSELMTDGPLKIHPPDELLTKVREAISDPNAPWHGSDLVSNVTELCDRYEGMTNG